MSGYGQFGPAKNKPSYDVSGQAMGGYMYMNGVSPTSGPLKVNPYLSDYITAYNACMVALAGYINAKNSGEGDSCDVAQYDTMFRLLDNYPANWFNKGYPKQGEPVPFRTGNKSDQAACFSFYDTKEGNAMFVAIVGQGPVTRGYPIIGMGKPRASRRTAPASRCLTPAARRRTSCARSSAPSTPAMRSRRSSTRQASRASALTARPTSRRIRSTRLARTSSSGMTSASAR